MCELQQWLDLNDEVEVVIVEPNVITRASPVDVDAHDDDASIGAVLILRAGIIESWKIPLV